MRHLFCMIMLCYSDIYAVLFIFEIWHIQKMKMMMMMMMMMMVMF